MIFPADIQYLLSVTGGMTLFGIAWWTFCFAFRNGIDGCKAIARAIKHRKPLLIRKILIGSWKPLGEYQPIKPHQPGIWEYWESM